MSSGSSGYSAQLAGQFGAALAFAHHFDTGGTLQALALYHQNFTRPVLDRPYAIVTANVLVAPTAEEALWLAGSGQLMTYAIRSGRFIPLLPPERTATPKYANGAPDAEQSHCRHTR